MRFEGASSENTRRKDTPSSRFHSIGEINVEAGPEQRGTEWQGKASSRIWSQGMVESP